jgi:hypothetical protein
MGCDSDGCMAQGALQKLETGACESGERGIGMTQVMDAQAGLA